MARSSGVCGYRADAVELRSNHKRKTPLVQAAWSNCICGHPKYRDGSQDAPTLAYLFVGGKYPVFFNPNFNNSSIGGAQ